MKKVIIPILLAMFIGYLCANYMLAIYEEDNSLNKIVYFLRKDDTNIGITSSLEEANRIKKIYKDNNIDINIKQIGIDNNNFYNELEQYDILLKNSKSFEEINNILETIIATYEEEEMHK